MESVSVSRDVHILIRVLGFFMFVCLDMDRTERKKISVFHKLSLSQQEIINDII